MFLLFSNLTGERQTEREREREKKKRERMIEVKRKKEKKGERKTEIESERKREREGKWTRKKNHLGIRNSPKISPCLSWSQSAGLSNLVSTSV